LQKKKKVHNQTWPFFWKSGFFTLMWKISEIDFSGCFARQQTPLL